MVSLRNGKVSSTDNVPDRATKRSAASNKDKNEKKRAKESEASEMKPEKKLKKEDSGKETGDASREDQNAQATTSPKPDENDSKDEQLAKSSVETKENVAASKIDTGRARDKLPTPGRNYDAVKDPKARDNLTRSVSPSTHGR